MCVCVCEHPSGHTVLKLHSALDMSYSHATHVREQHWNMAGMCMQSLTAGHSSHLSEHLGCRSTDKNLFQSPVAIILNLVYLFMISSAFIYYLHLNFWDRVAHWVWDSGFSLGHLANEVP